MRSARGKMQRIEKAIKPKPKYTMPPVVTVVVENGLYKTKEKEYTKAEWEKYSKEELSARVIIYDDIDGTTKAIEKRESGQPNP